MPEKTWGAYTVKINMVITGKEDIKKPIRGGNTLKFDEGAGNSTKGEQRTSDEVKKKNPKLV